MERKEPLETLEGMTTNTNYISIRFIISFVIIYERARAIARVFLYCLRSWCSWFTYRIVIDGTA